MSQRQRASIKDNFCPSIPLTYQEQRQQNDDEQKYRILEPPYPLPSSPTDAIHSCLFHHNNSVISHSYCKQEYQYYQQQEQQQEKIQLPSLHSMLLSWPSSQPQETIILYENVPYPYPYFLRYYYQQLPQGLQYQRVPPPPDVHRPIPRYPHQHSPPTTISTPSIPDHDSNIPLSPNTTKTRTSSNQHDASVNNDNRSSASGSDNTSNMTTRSTYGKSNHSQKKGKQRRGTQRPRWTDQERKKLLLAVINEKKLKKMSSFRWHAISQKVNRVQKVCKKEWRQDLLPSFIQLIAQGTNRRATIHTTTNNNASAASSSNANIIIMDEEDDDDHDEDDSDSFSDYNEDEEDDTYEEDDDDDETTLLVFHPHKQVMTQRR